MATSLNIGRLRDATDGEIIANVISASTLNVASHGSRRKRTLPRKNSTAGVSVGHPRRVVTSRTLLSTRAEMTSYGKRSFYEC